jgi:hypothetical protein
MDHPLPERSSEGAVAAPDATRPETPRAWEWPLLGLVRLLALPFLSAALLVWCLAYAASALGGIAGRLLGFPRDVPGPADPTSKPDLLSGP